VTDANGAVGMNRFVLEAAPFVGPFVSPIISPLVPVVGQYITLATSVTGGVPPYTYAWTVAGDGLDTPLTSTLSSFAFSAPAAAEYDATLTVTDSHGTVGRGFTFATASDTGIRGFADAVVEPGSGGAAGDHYGVARGRHAALYV